MVKCEADNHLLKIGTKTNDPTTANLLRSLPLESDSEYETEEVYELSEWAADSALNFLYPLGETIHMSHSIQRKKKNLKS